MDIHITLPVAFSVRDQHEFRSHRDVLTRINPSLIVKELTTGIHVNGGPTVYWGVVYVKGQEISDGEVISALKQAGYDFSHNNQCIAWTTSDDV